MPAPLSARRLGHVALSALLGAVFADPAHAQDAQAPKTASAPAGVRYALFNGRDLSGWQVTGCEADVVDGALRLKAGDGFVRTDLRYADFVLELDWKPLAEAKWDSGIYIRCELPEGKRPWPTRYQINLKQGDEARLIGVPNAKPATVKPGDWNHLKVTVTGSKAECEVNGRPAWQLEGLEPRHGYIGFQAEVPLGGQFLFKNITVVELGFKPLFNGQDLTGWEGAGQDAALCWQVVDGLLMCTGKKGPWLRSQGEHADFSLRLDYKLNAGGNSGVFCRVPADGNHHGKDPGVEVQLLDDRHEKHKALKPWQYTGSVYDIAPAREHVGRPVGEWNSIEIQTTGASYRITHNGLVIVNAAEGEFPLLKERRLNGFLGLQNHSTPVWFRNIRIGPPLP